MITRVDMAVSAYDTYKEIEEKYYTLKDYFETFYQSLSDEDKKEFCDFTDYKEETV